MTSELFLAEAARLTETYQANPDTLAALSTYVVTTVSGPTGVGKDTVMEQSGLHVVKGTTSRSRERRDGEHSYRFVETADDEEAVITALRSGTLAQATIHPTTGHFYGTLLEDFGPAYGSVVFDVIPRQFHEFRDNHLFSNLQAAYIVAPDFLTWQQRRRERDAEDPADLEKRFTEARTSLTIAVEDDEFFCIINDDVATAAHTLRVYAQEQRRLQNDAQGRAAARHMLAGLLANGRD